MPWVTKVDLDALQSSVESLSRRVAALSRENSFLKERIKNETSTPRYEARGGEVCHFGSQSERELERGYSVKTDESDNILIFDERGHRVLYAPMEKYGYSISNIPIIEQSNKGEV